MAASAIWTSGNPFGPNGWMRRGLGGRGNAAGAGSEGTRGGADQTSRATVAARSLLRMASAFPATAMISSILTGTR
jgi:hypothetical protein